MNDGLNFSHQLAQLVAVGKFDVLLGEVEFQLDEAGEVEQFLAQFLDFVEAQLAIELRRVLYEGGF